MKKEENYEKGIKKEGRMKRREQEGKEQEEKKECKRKGWSKDENKQEEIEGKV